VELIDHAGAVPAVTVALESVVWRLADRIEPLDLEAIKATAFSEPAKRQAEERSTETHRLHEMLAEYEDAEAATLVAAERNLQEKEAERQEKTAKKLERKEAKRRRKADEKQAEAERQEGTQAAKKPELEVQKRDREETVQVLQEKKQRMALISIRIKRSLYKCSCKQPLHQEKCKIRNGSGGIMWPGAEFGVKTEDVRWLEQEKV
jgi:hypothetical protein